MLSWEMYAGKKPFAEAHNPAFAAFLRLRTGERPLRTDIKRGELTQNTWEIIEDCWHKDPERRPTMQAVLRRIPDVGL